MLAGSIVKIDKMLSAKVLFDELMSIDGAANTGMS
jgi:hypothetical protein